MLPLEKTLRNKLEHTIKEARGIAEHAARVAIDQLGVGEATPYSHLSNEDRELRRRLRIHGRQLGDQLVPKSKTQEIERLVEEVAYEQWHRMLFARFLAENNLLMYPDPVDPVAVTLEECEDLAADEGAKNGWELASRFAALMLPQIFRPNSSVFQLALPPEHQQRLEKLLDELPMEVFTASDSLGWVYQFWQSKRKDEVNLSGVKIGARELPAVTQLFTEPYMVSFLLDNSLGAWWASRRLSEEDLKNAQSEDELRAKAALPGVPLEYLRFVRSPLGVDRGFDCLPLPLGEGRGEGKKKARLPPHILANARKLRKKQTDAEQLLWSLLRDRRFLDKKFRRQHPIARYIIDFYCHEKKLAIELDGGQHNEEQSKNYDEKRTAFLNEQGLTVLRFWNNQVFQETESVLEAIYHALKEVPSPPAPLPEGEGGLWATAAGTFDGWPEHLSELKVLDPCCGSGHFLVAAFLMLVPMRMELEDLSARDAVDAVLRDNLHGLEIDQRCVELAAFALALTAWRYPNLPSTIMSPLPFNPPSPSGRGAGGEGPIGYRPLPELALACSGLSLSVDKDEWKKIAPEEQRLRIALELMYDQFMDAPVLGSLINPVKSKAAKVVEWSVLSQALETAFEKEQGEVEREMGVVAQGLARAARMLAGKYHWVVTNVPYLARGKQGEILQDFCRRRYPAGKNDIATVFLERCLEFCFEGGNVSVVLPQNWLFLTTYRQFRERMLKEHTWQLLARLGPGAFETISGEVVKAVLLSISRGGGCEDPAGLFAKDVVGDDARCLMAGVDVSARRTAGEKAEGLYDTEIRMVSQARQLENPDARVALEDRGFCVLLESYAYSHHGLTSGDMPRMKFSFWEIVERRKTWIPFQGTVGECSHFGGNQTLLRWEGGVGIISELLGARKDGTQAWGKKGILISQMQELPVTFYNKFAFDNNTAVIVPQNPDHLPAIWCFCSSPQYNEAVRQIDQSLKVTNATLVKVPFDLAYWQKVATEKYPNGLPKPHSNDPTQWIFHGHPAKSEHPLQVAVARLLGYRWPAELDEEMELSDEQRAWVRKSQTLALTPALSQREREKVKSLPLFQKEREKVKSPPRSKGGVSGQPLVDEDGIVCIPSVQGEASGADRLLNLLAAAYDDDWSTDTLSELLKQADHAGKSLETWLRDKFFLQHCKLFHHRSFIWHIWDGLSDGFAALVNYHKLDYKNLETLIYTYLGDWIIRQKDDRQNGVDGAEEKLAAAENLKKKLELILKGESPHDIFVRWKPIKEQPIGWNPNHNDGVRLNIRPFMTVGDVKKKGAGVLREKPNVKWNKDRGKDVPSAPWYHLGPQYGGNEGDRINDYHLTIEEKLAARKGKGGS